MFYWFYPFASYCHVSAIVAIEFFLGQTACRQTLKCSDSVHFLFWHATWKFNGHCLSRNVMTHARYFETIKYLEQRLIKSILIKISWCFVRLFIFPISTNYLSDRIGLKRYPDILYTFAVVGHIANVYIFSGNLFI